MKWYKIKEKFISWFGDILVYPYPMFVMFGHTSYEMKGNDIRNVLNTIKPGNILLRRYNRYLSGLMIPGYFTHSAIYIGDNQVIHMLGEGINKEDILTFCRCDSMAIINCHNEQINTKAIESAIFLYEQKIEYDFDFDFLDKTRLSCTEIINYIFDSPEMEWKKSYIVPDDFLTLKYPFKISYQKEKVP
jgi:hypothetical protein